MFILYLATLIAAVVAIEPNAVVDEPELICGADTMSIEVRTERPFAGHIFVKEHFAQPECRFTADTEAEKRQSSARLALAFESCGIARRRVPGVGMSLGVIVIVAFDSVLLGKHDRAYMLRCFYMQAEKIVTAQLEIDMLSTQLRTEQVPMPICRYEVLDAPNGQQVDYARIGEAVWHRWTCESDQPDIFCMLVHSCRVDDGHGDIIDLLDVDGCALDHHLLDNLDYLPDRLQALKESHVFKYYDRPDLFFDCQISITVREPGQICQAPRCVTNLRRNKRSLTSEKFTQHTSDVACLSIIDLTAFGAINAALLTATGSLVYASTRLLRQRRD